MKAFVLIVISLLSLSSVYHSRTRNDSTAHPNRVLQDTSQSPKLIEQNLEISIAGKEGFLNLVSESIFLKAAFEQSLKDFINTCADDIDAATILSLIIDIPETPQDDQGRLRRLSETDSCVLMNTNLGNASNINCYLVAKSKCDGSRKKCSERVNGRYLDNLKTNNSSKSKSKDCVFDIKDIFLKKNMTLSSFKYDFQFDDSNFDKDLSFSFDITSKTTVLADQVQDLFADVIDETEIDFDCVGDCVNQDTIIQEIFEVFEINFRKEKHVCAQIGINCDEDNLITHIWSKLCVSQYSILFSHT